jgi:alkanesulfonate monooxygenase SsuD/methylene tetrahydromethanopterin reductase-like flavin-dependent oxidoreductase (luciferase family)
MITHLFATEDYVRGAIVPILEAAFAATGRDRRDFQLCRRVLVVTGATVEEMSAATAAARKQLAFYASTPAYLPVLELHGWEQLHTELYPMSRRGEWSAMADLVDDEVLNAFAVVAEPDQLADHVRHRFEGLVDRVTLTDPANFVASDPLRVFADLKHRSS